MPIIRSNHLARARNERQMADQSASNVERIIHNKLADLHSAAGQARPAEPLVDGEVV
ncbi:hypothetical protein GCM10022268_35980 [Sphingomonas cynarae]|uniref:Uncharacterized protein n=1 Tax=Sphingomonas cynarae TaxID=930197 RepID=A0ABP7EVP5_9SPHN